MLFLFTTEIAHVASPAEKPGEGRFLDLFQKKKKKRQKKTGNLSIFC